MAKTQTVTQNTSSEPWKPVQSYLEDFLKQASGVLGGGGTPGLSGFGGGPENGIPGAGGGGGSNLFTPTQSDATKRAYQMISDMAGGGTATTDAAGSAIRGILSGSDPSSSALADYASGKFVNGGSPEWNSMIDRQSGQLATDINRGWSVNGRYGSAGQMADLGSQIGNFRNDAMSSELMREQSNQLNAANILGGQKLSAAGMAPTLDAARYLPAEMLGKAGAGQDAYNWAVQQAPYERLKAYGGILTGLGGMGGNQTTTQQTPYSPFMNALGGGLGILQLLSGFV